MKSPQNPHDALFKATFTDKEIAEDYIRNFLPKNLVENLNLESLALEPGSYISPELEPYFSDILYRCEYGNKKITISLLFEHKSTPPTYPHLQLLRYMVGAWEEVVKNKEPLEPIVPIIVYHGKRKWKKRPFQSYFRNIEEPLLPYIPAFDYLLTDLATWSDEGLLALEAGLLINTFLLLKHYGEDEFIKNSFQTLFYLTEEHIEDESKRNQILSFIVYLWKTTDIEDTEFIHLLESLPTSVNQETMTTYEQIILKGIKKGKIEGKTENENLVIKNAVAVGLDEKLIAQITALPLKEVLERIQQLGLEK